jgi:hypothetical protein
MANLLNNKKELLWFGVAAAKIAVSARARRGPGVRRPAVSYPGPSSP